MKYIKTTVAIGPWEEPKWWKKGIVKFLYLILPKANPDFDNFYKDVRLWWLEIDEGYIPQREIGFDKNGNVVVAGPIGNNYGFWTDPGESVEDIEFIEIDSNEFLRVWSEFEKKLNEKSANT